jgi:hypothetical protein
MVGSPPSIPLSLFLSLLLSFLPT